MYKVESNLGDRRVLSEQDIEELLGSLDDKKNDSEAIKKYKALVRKLKKENERLSLNLTSLKGTVSELKDEKQELSRKVKRLEGIEKKFEQEYDTKVKSLEDSFAKKESELRESTREKERLLQERLIERDAEIEQMVKDNKANERHIIREYEIKIKELNREHTKEVEDFNDRLEQAGIEAKLLAQENIKLRKVCNTVSDEIDTHIADITGALNEISKLKGFIVSETEVQLDNDDSSDEEFFAKFFQALSALKDSDTISVRQIRKLMQG